MPATSEKQRIAMAIAEHQPNKLYTKNKGMLKMTHRQLHEFATKIKKGKKAKRNKYSEALKP